MVGRRWAFGVGCAFLAQGLVVPTAAHADAGVTVQIVAPSVLTSWSPQEIDVKVTNAGAAVANGNGMVKIGDSGAARLPSSIDRFDPVSHAWKSVPIVFDQAGGDNHGSISFGVAIPAGTSTEKFRFTPAAGEMGDGVLFSAAYWGTTMPPDPWASATVPVAKPQVTINVHTLAAKVGGPPQTIVAAFADTTTVPMPTVTPTVGLQFMLPNPGPGNGTQADVPPADVKIDWLNGAAWQPVTVAAAGPSAAMPLVATIPGSFPLAAGAQRLITLRIALAAGTIPVPATGVLAVAASQFASDEASISVTAPPTPTPAPTTSASKSPTPSAPPTTPTTSAPQTPTPSASITGTPTPTMTDTGTSTPTDDSSMAPAASASLNGPAGSGSQLPVILGAIAALGVAGACLTLWWKKYR
jgi:hypothetical protein